MKEKIDSTNIPKHIAIIMDGNGRWAKQRGAARLFGHRNAIQAVRDSAEACAEIGVDRLTLYAFSTENWSRPKAEVDGLMNLLVSTIKKEIPTLMKNNIRLQPLGDILHLPKEAQKNLQYGIDQTASNDGMILSLALNYSGRWEIGESVKCLVEDLKNKKIEFDEINNQFINQYISEHTIPDVELMIRTSGEHRISNFLLWQVAYAELFFTETLWPDFRKNDLFEAVIDFQKRERRYGKISEQLTQ
ncbi:isoprenyl transferase [Reichenbachiella agarivorans]|uniref:Isoprenyl transferase n=1 Tax=Reichenbachiella agarivorans TaxID=2979464 RepID=A0ABY6CZN8_9BACT|nr:isoprenyl transferase [Reichenbachiella agarivorans]UXP33705.1 isoprenyl transferase [Reichenbachiella agarivorans]